MRYGRKRQLSHEHWQNIACLENTLTDQDIADIEFRRSILKKIMPVIDEIIQQALTSKQREIWELYFSSDENTQKHIAEILGIRQPTVSQQLNGRLRNGVRIGGAVRRIRKHIRLKINTSKSRTPAISMLSIFDQLLREAQTRRSAHENLESITSQAK